MTRVPWSLFTDLYQLTMAQGYWREGLARRRANFQLTLRRAPFGGGFAVCCGLPDALQAIEDLRFDEDAIAALAALKDARGEGLFAQDFLDFLAAERMVLDVWAPPEGEVVLPGEPMVRVEGPLLQGQLVETLLLNLVGYQSLVATKAARIAWLAAQGDPVLDFGLRRAHGPDGGVSMSRAAHVGGCSATSHVLAGARFGIPVAGTHAHSWVLAFADELESFRAFSRAQPSNCTLLIDTYGTMRGLENAIVVAREMAQRGERLDAVRLDSGDLESLSRAVRQRLDEAGLTEVRIVASNDLDEESILRLRSKAAPIDRWGVGTSLASCRQDPSFSGAYKLTAIETDDGWRAVSKRSEDPFKRSDPGRLQVRRSFGARGEVRRDVIYPLSGDPPTRSGSAVDLLQVQMKAGASLVSAERSELAEARARARASVASLPPLLGQLTVTAESIAEVVVVDAGLLRLRQRVAHAETVD